MKSCVPEVMDEGKTQEQAVGKCLGMWDNADESDEMSDTVANQASQIVQEKIENGTEPEQAIDEVQSLIHQHR